jgi:hypothetical protein
MCNSGLLFFLSTVLICGSAAAQRSLPPLPDTMAKKLSLRVLPQNFYSQHLSFFCQKEVQLQRLTMLPLFLRAGSKDYVDYLEKKPNAVWPPR